MNISISYNWLKEYLPTKKTPADLARLLSLCGPSVERIYHKGSEWEKMVVGVILDIKPHPGADKLRIAVTDIGRKKLEIVCGGSNISKGMKVVVALSGARVRWHGEGEFVELKPTEIRGVKSEAMIAAANEIGLFEAFPHKEREVLDLGWCPVPVGTPIVTALELEDYLLDTEVTTNRPDLLSIVGFSREAAAILGEKLNQKKINSLEVFPRPELKETVSVKVESRKLCPRYIAVLVKGVKVSPSPWWMKKRLLAAGIRPISNVVDITNYVMLEMGQPMHAFDAKRISGGIIVRTAKNGEKIQALDGNTYKLTNGMLVIADSKKPVAIAGVMGGAESGVHEGTTEVILESATFDPASVRRSSRELNLRSESSSRFEKGLSTDLPHRAISRAVQLMHELACSSHGPMTDVKSGAYKPLKFSLLPEEAQKLIGVQVPVGEMKRILISLGFRLQALGSRIKVTVPYFRDHDIESGRDLVEEVARVYGYHKLPSVLPMGEIPIREKHVDLKWEDKIKQALAGAGYNETITYSFASAGAMEKAGFNKSSALRLANPLTSDFEFMRTSLIPSALEVVAKNQENFPTVKLFEIANTYHQRKNNLPEEKPNLLVTISAKKTESSPFYAGKGALELIACRFGLSELSLKRIAFDSPLWHPGRSAQVFVGGKLAGTVGEIHPAVLKRFGIEHRVAMLELALTDLYQAMREIGEYSLVAEFPAAKRDISFVLGERTTYEEVVKIIKDASELIAGVELFDVYSGPLTALGVNKKSMAFHLTYQSKERTLSSFEVEAAHSKLADMLKLKLRAEVRKG